MKIFSSYVRKSFYKSCLAIFFTLACFLFFFTLSAQVKFINHEYNFLRATIYAIYVIPVNIYSLAPFLFISSLWLCFYRLHINGEILHFFTIGIKPFNIARWLFFPCLNVIFLLFIIGDIVGPYAEISAKKHRMQAMMDYDVVEKEDGLWLKEEDGFVYAKRDYKSNYLRDIYKCVFKNNVLKYIYISKNAYFHQGEWVMSPVEIIDFDGEIHHSKVDKVNWDTKLTPELLSLSTTDIKHMPFFKMLRALWLDSFNIFSIQDSWLLWQRIFSPLYLYAISLILIFKFANIIFWRKNKEAFFHLLSSSVALWFLVLFLIKWLRYIFLLWPFCIYLSLLFILFSFICFIVYGNIFKMKF